MPGDHTRSPHFAKLVRFTPAEAVLLDRLATRLGLPANKVLQLLVHQADRLLTQKP